VKQITTKSVNSFKKWFLPNQSCLH